MPNETLQQRPFWRLRRFGALLIGLMVLALLAACGTDAGVGETENEMAGDTAGIAEFSEITDDPDAFIGQTVTVRGDMDEILGSSSFTLKDPALLGQDTLLVVGAENVVFPDDLAIFTPGEEADANVEVTGTVREFTVSDLQTVYGIDADIGLYEPYESRPVIVADTVETITSQ